MIPIALGVRVWVATRHTDMRRGMNSLALLVQEALHRDPHGGDLYAFRGKRGKLINILWHDGLGITVRQTAGARSFSVAIVDRWRGDDHTGPARLPA